MKIEYPMPHAMPQDQSAGPLPQNGYPPYGYNPYGNQYPHGYHNHPYMHGYHHGYAPYPYGMPQLPYGHHHAETPPGGRLIKGALIGAAAAYLLTNEAVQRSTIRSLVKVWNLARGGVEEIKERFQDAHAELQADKE